MAHRLKLFSGSCWNVNNMIGATLLVWIGGVIIAMCGSLRFVDLGLKFPRNPGPLVQAFAQYYWIATFSPSVMIEHRELYNTLKDLTFCGSLVIVTADHRRYFPVFSDKLRRISKRGTPTNALIFQCFLSAIVIILVGGVHPNYPNSFQILYSMAQYTSMALWVTFNLEITNVDFWWWTVISIFIACSLYITVVSFVETNDSEDPSNPN
ncbi:7575_t:CDS:2, partial [Diversispora eburnea]